MINNQLPLNIFFWKICIRNESSSCNFFHKVLDLTPTDTCLICSGNNKSHYGIRREYNQAKSALMHEKSPTEHMGTLEPLQ